MLKINIQEDMILFDFQIVDTHSSQVSNTLSSHLMLYNICCNCCAVEEFLLLWTQSALQLFFFLGHTAEILRYRI